MRAERNKLTILLYSIFLVYFSYGLYITASGSLTVSIMDFFHIDTATRGFLLLLQGLGGLSAFILLMLFGERSNKLLVFLAGILLMSFSGIIISYNNHLLLYTFLLYTGGIGMLLIDSLCNAVVSDIYIEQQQNKYIPLLHFSFGAGAVLSNIIIIFIIHNNQAVPWQSVYFVFSIIGFCASLVLAISIFRARDRIVYFLQKKNMQKAKKDEEKLGSILKNLNTWKVFIGAICFSSFYVTMITWLPFYWEKVLLFDPTLSKLAISILFTGILLMRYISPFLLRRFLPQTLVFIGGLSGGACIILSLIVSSPILTIALTALGGFFLGGNFPLMALVACRLFPGRTSFGSSLVPFSVTLAMLFVPWLTGEIAAVSNMLTALILSGGLLIISGPFVFSVKIR